MSGAVRFIAVLVACLALLAWGSLTIVTGTARHWLERDLALRAELAVNGSRRAIAAHWRSGEWTALHDLLADITHDERIMAAATCGPDGGMVASTAGYPPQLSCPSLVGRVREPGGAGEASPRLGEAALGVEGAA